MKRIIGLVAVSIAMMFVLVGCGGGGGGGVGTTAIAAPATLFNAGVTKTIMFNGDIFTINGSTKFITTTSEITMIGNLIVWTDDATISPYYLPPGTGTGHWVTPANRQVAYPASMIAYIYEGQ